MIHLVLDVHGVGHVHRLICFRDILLSPDTKDNPSTYVLNLDYRYELPQNRKKRGQDNRCEFKIYLSVTMICLNKKLLQGLLKQNENNIFNFTFKKKEVDSLFCESHRKIQNCHYVSFGWC